MFSAPHKVRNYLAARPAIVECLRLGIVNYSALAREIGPASARDALVQALRRYQARLKRERSTEDRLARVLQKVEVVIRTNVALFQLTRTLSDGERNKLLERRKGGFLHVFEGETRSIVACSSDSVHALPSSIRSGSIFVPSLAQVAIRHSAEVAKFPGVLARLLGVLAQHDILVVETVTCVGEQLLYVESRDIQKIMELIDTGYTASRKK
jgi:hypothetical protein